MSKGGVIYQLLKKLSSNGKYQYSWKQSAAGGNTNGHLLPKSDTKPKQQPGHRTSGRHLCMIMLLAFLSMLAVGSLLSPHLPYTAHACGGYVFFSSSRCSSVISAKDDQDQLVTGTDPAQLATGTDPMQLVTSTDPTQLTTRTDPTQLVTGTDPTQLVTSTDPTQLTTSTDPTQLVTSTDPTQVTTSTDPTQLVTSTDPTQLATSTDPSTQLTTSTDPTQSVTSTDSTQLATSTPTELVTGTPTIKQREFNTDDEINARLSYKEILSVELPRPKNPKIAFMFLAVSTLPFEKLWDMFFQGNEGKFSVFVHASEMKPTHTSKYFVNSTIRSDTVEWGKISMVDAERRLLAQAFKDPDNWHFVLLSDSCVPVHTFDYVYAHLIESNISFVSRFQDPGVHGSGRYIDYMLPEVEYTDFMKGSQWFAVKRQHALLILVDSLYYTKFKLHCKPGMEGDRNCYSDEHYLPTFFYMIDPTGIANWSVTHVDWSERKWHPKEYSEPEVTFDLLKNITSIDVNVHITSEVEFVEKRDTCMWNGRRKPCYLFARKFDPDSLQNLIDLFPKFKSLEQPAEV